MLRFSPPVLTPEMERVFSSARGDKVLVPNLFDCLGDWPAKQVNPRREALREHIDGRLEQTRLDRAVIDKKKKADLALGTALWLPHAQWNELKHIADFNAWFFCWDDLVDSDEGELALALDAADAYRSRTLAIFKRGLGLCPPNEAVLEGQIDSVNAMMQSFFEDLCRQYDQDKRRDLYEAFEHFVQACAVEQRMRLNQQVPDFEAYLTMRMGTICAFPALALSEYACRVSLPRDIATSTDMQLLQREACIAILLINDILSLKKELEMMCMSNAIVVLMVKSGLTVQAAVQEVAGRLRVCADAFDQAGRNLESLVSDQESDALRRVLEVQRCLVTSTIEWSLRSDRYKIVELDNGVSEFVL
ncbi:hypothetical protein HIM_06213 [Hirsutella minnesotensis 3608]|uniref:Terpene synthase n=1 Tax=Hirsutella minnesotensis 3608 TaxID=1043627 RepID=A0A0F7ZU81_9HYPO|nr:hypothetical protein HIM_06213 [Hirsutella minnesotensis 3608]